MDSDRKSTASSFYGRKTSMDALNTDYPSASPNYGGRPRDDASSFYGARPGPGTAGYNRNSFFHAGREEPLKGGDEESGGPPEGGFDIYADFNNAGPKYSSGLGQHFTGQQSHDYRPIAPSPKFDDSQSTTGPVELVTVPALGPEWQKDELKDMTKTGRKQKKAERRKGKWVAWKRGESGLCGTYFTRRFTVFLLFGLCIVAGILLAFMIPRVPAFAISGDSPLSNATGDWFDAVPTYFSRAPANFSFPAFAELQIHTGSNFLPLTFNHLYGTVYDLQTNRKVATGDLGHRTVPAKAFTDIQLPLNFTYVATNDTDQTWANWYNGCKNVGATQTGTRDAVKFRLELKMYIAGLIGSRLSSTTVSAAECPIELAINAA